MPKEGEIIYFKDMDAGRLGYEIRKPFSDRFCGRHLAEIGTIMALLPPPPAKVLDLGCGLGWTSRFLALRGYEVTGVDISPDAITLAEEMRTKESISNLEFIRSDYERLEVPESFDAAVFFESLHHAENEEDAIRAAWRALKPGGILVTSEPGVGNENSEGAIEARESFNVTERDLPPRAIINAAKRVGFRSFRVFPHANGLVAAIYANEFANPLLRKLFQIQMFRSLVGIYLIVVHKHLDGIVRMEK